MSNVLDLKDQEPGKAPEPEPVEPETVDPVSTLAAAMFPSVRTVAWSAHDALPEHGRRRQFMVMAAAAALGGLIAWWQGSWLILLVVLLGLGAWELRERFVRPVSVTLDERGVSVDETHYPYAELTSFDIHQMPDGAVDLSVRTNKWGIPHLRLPLGEQNPQEVDAVLSQYIVRERHPIPLVDWHLRKP